MTIENSEDTAQKSVPDAAEPVIESASSSSEPARDGAAQPELDSLARLEVARNLSGHDSAPPMSRKLAPPPKPKRDSGMASSLPPGGAAEASADLLAASASALKAPHAPSISYSADDTAKMQVSPALLESTLPEPPVPLALPELTLDAPVVSTPLSQPPPMRRRSSPALLATDADSSTSSPPRPVSAPPRPRSDPPPPRPRSDPSLADPAEAAPSASAPSSPAPSPIAPAPSPIAPAPSPIAPAPSPIAPAPPTTSAIFAMRIIAVGDSVRAPTVQDNAPDLDPDSYPPSASRLGTGMRRSSRPAAAATHTPVEVPAPARVPAEASNVAVVAAPEAAASAGATPSKPADSAPEVSTGPEIPIDEDIPIEVEPPRPSSPAFPPVTGPPSYPPLAAASSPGVRPPPPPPPVELGALPTEELRPPPPPPPTDLGAVPPEELREKLAVAEGAPALAPEATAKSATPEESAKAATPDAEELGREDAISLPPEELAALKAELDAELEAKAEAVKPPPPPKRTTGVLGVAPTVSDVAPKEPPPIPDPAAAKAAQRAKTRQPWWEDLFNEDFMRANFRVSDEQIRREVTFIEESLGVAAGGVVLDLGCGAGHHAVEFASRGYGVVGYDLSLYQLALAADVAQERSQKINFLQGDMREMAFEEMFDGVFCWNTTFGYFEEDKNLAVAQRVFKALRPGGMFLIDVLNRDFAAASAPCSVWYEGESCVCMDDMSVDYISSRLRVKRSIILDDGRTKESVYSLRLYSLHELGKLLHEVGFRVTEASGHPSTPGVFFGPNSPRIIMLAQRP